MDLEASSTTKRPWHEPEIVEVGGVSEVTTGGPSGNVKDESADVSSPTWRPFTRSGNDHNEVDLDGR